jgi:hypothetical protein
MRILCFTYSNTAMGRVVGHRPRDRAFYCNWLRTATSHCKEQRNQVSESNKMPNSNPMGLKPGYLNWWQSLLLAFACTLAGVLGAVAASTGGTVLPNGEVSSWAADLLKLVPHAMMLFGLMADAITYDAVYWTSTIAGLSAMPAHGTLESILGGLGKMFEFILGGTSAPTQPQGGGMSGGGFSGCSILGGDMETFHKTSQSLVVTSTIVCYFFFDLLLNRGMINALGILVVGIVLMGGQALSISDCFKRQNKSLTAGVLYGAIVWCHHRWSMVCVFPGLLPSLSAELRSFLCRTPSAVSA